MGQQSYSKTGAKQHIIYRMQSVHQLMFGNLASSALQDDTKARLLKFVAICGSVLTLVVMVSRFYLIGQIEAHFVANIVALGIVYLLARAHKVEVASWVLIVISWFSIVIAGYDSIAIFYGSITAHVTLLLGVIWLISSRALPWFFTASSLYIGYEAIFGQFALAISGSRASAIANGIGQFIFLLIGVMAVTLVSGIMSNQYNRQVAAAADLEKLNDALRDSEARYRLMVDNSAEAIFVLNLNGWQIVDANQNACQTFGYTREELMTMSTTDLLSAEFRAKLPNLLPFNLSEKLLRGEEATIELEHMTAEGIPFLGEVRLVPLAGNIPLVRTSIIDITERKATEQELQESWAHLRLMMDNLPADIAYIDQDLTFSYGNASFAQSFAFDPDTEARSVKELLGDELFAHREPLLMRAFAGETVSFEFQFNERARLLGKTINLTYAPHIVNDVVLGIFVIGVDVTKVRSAEKALAKTTNIIHAILDHHPAKITYVDTNRQAQFVSKQFTELGLNPDDILGANPIDLMPDSYRDAITSPMIQAMKTRQHVKTEIAYTATDGEEAIDTYEIIPHMVDGVLQGVISLSHNVTDQRKTEYALQQSQRAESLGVLAGGIAHDFNNLLAAILSQNSIALYKLPAEHPARRHIDKSVAASKRAATLTQQMLAYSGRGQFEVRELDLNEMIVQNSGLFELSVPKHVRLKLSLQDSLPNVKVDVAQIQQVVMNLIINAVQAMSEEDGQIEISTTTQLLTKNETIDWSHSAETLKPGNYVRIDVTDNGSGMNEETKSHIFDPFFTTKSTGTGLGLAAVLGIVHSHGGGLDVVSKLGAGTTFSILLPASKPRASEINKTEPVIPLQAG